MGLKVNFSQNEAESTVREVPPSGEYHCKIVEIETKEVKPTSKNVGKPYWNVQFVAQSDKYAGSRFFSNIMLFEGVDGTLGALSQFLKALDFDVQAGEFELPEPDELIGRDINIRGTKLLAGYDKKAGKDLPDRFQVRGYKKANVAIKQRTDQLLP
jgi:hypothetical protein